MSKTALTVVTALLLSVLSIGLIAHRWYVLGSEIDGTPGDATWKVTLQIDGELTDPDATVTNVLPPDFRRQHIVDETFDSEQMSHAVRTSKSGGQRRAVWRRRPGAVKRQPFHAVYSFRCVMGMRRPTPGMSQRTRALEAQPSGNTREIRPAPLIQSDDPAVIRRAKELTEHASDDDERARVLFDHVAEYPSGEELDAVACLDEGRGSRAAKARLLVALLRSLRIPARIVSGLILRNDGLQELHHWCEAWVEERWLPMDPNERHFGAGRFPSSYLVIRLGDDLVRGQGARTQFAFRAVDLHDSLQGAPPPTTAKRVWRKLSLGNLRPEEQGWIKFLLLLPVGALAVCVFRTVIGINTFGTFGPALLGLVCRDLSDFPWALGIFVGIMLAGWVIRRLLDRYNLLMVPRISVLLTSIVILLILSMMLLGPYAGATRGYVALLPLIILTHMIERFWTVETEDGTAASFKTLLGTVTVAVVITLVVNFDVPVNAVARLLHTGPVVSHDLMRTTLFRYPEALGLVLAAQLLLGRYTGYRLTELFRFRDLLIEETTSGENNESVGADVSPAGNGRAGDEPTQHRVHPGS